MKRSLLAISLVLMLGVMTSLSYAQTRAGTSAAPELTIPVGARSMAMQGSALAFVEGVNAIYWNPAGVDVGTGSASALFSYRKYIADIGVNYLAVGAKLGFGTIGLSLRAFNIGTIDVTTESQPDGTGERISPTFFVAGLTYSKALTDRISVGFTVNLINESFGLVSASGVAFDAGVQYQDLIGIKGLGLGVAVKNVGTPMQYGGSGLWVQASDPNTNRGLTYYKVEAAKSQMPSTIDIGLGYKLPLSKDNSLSVNAAFENNNYALDQYRGGVEYGFMGSLFLRAGYMYSTAQSGTKSIFQNYTLGAGVNLTKLTGLGISFDYAFVPISNYFSANHLFDLYLTF